RRGGRDGRGRDDDRPRGGRRGRGRRGRRPEGRDRGDPGQRGRRGRRRGGALGRADLGGEVSVQVRLGPAGHVEIDVADVRVRLGALDTDARRDVPVHHRRGSLVGRRRDRAVDGRVHRDLAARGDLARAGERTGGEGD